MPLYSVRALLRFLFAPADMRGTRRRLVAALAALALIAVVCRAGGELLACLARQAPRGTQWPDFYASLLVAYTVTCAGVALLPVAALVVQLRSLWQAARGHSSKDGSSPPGA